MANTDKKIIEMLTREISNREPIKSIIEEVVEDIDLCDEELFDLNF